MSLFLKTAVAIAAIYLLLVLAGWLVQRRLMYFPSLERVSPASVGLPEASERVLETPDGARVLMWYAPAKSGAPTILYFHGNGGSLKERSERFARYTEGGLGMLMMTYRGYGGSTGTPSEAANVADAKLAYAWLIENGVAARDIILYGESLGSGIATQIAAANPVRGLVLDAPYTSIVDVAARQYPFLPVRALLLDRYETLRYIGRVKAPLLIIQGERDQVIPVGMGRAVYAAAPEPKRMITFPDAGHSNHHRYGSTAAVLGWIADLTRMNERRAQ